jgi:alpha-glucosidase
VRAGAILPMETSAQLTLHVYCPEVGESRQSNIYSDVGDGHGAHRLDRLQVVRLADALEITWEAEGDYAPPCTNCRVQVHGFAPTRAVIDAQERPVEDGSVETAPFWHLRFL